MDKKYIIIALSYALVGLILGSVMAATKNHGQMVTHAHIMLLGFVTTFSYGLCYKLWITNSSTKVAKSQFVLHQLGTILMLSGLYMMYGNLIENHKIEALMGISSVAVILGLILMIYQLIQTNRDNQ